MDNPATFFFVFFAIFFAILGFGGGILTEYVNVRHMRNLTVYMKYFIWIACFFFLVACFMSLPHILGSAWILGTIAVIIVILVFKTIFNSGTVSSTVSSVFPSVGRFLRTNIPNIPDIGLNPMPPLNFNSFDSLNPRNWTGSVIGNKFRQLFTQKDQVANVA